MNPKVDEYLRKTKKWQQEMEKLRHICLACGLTEELKWSKPCYTFQESNIKGSQWCSEKIWLAGGTSDSVHQCSRNNCDGAHLENLYP